MALLKFAENSQFVTYLDLSDNNLNDEFAINACKTLKDCLNLTTIKMSENSINLQRMLTVNATIEHNKNILAKQKIPKYLKQISKLENKGADYDKLTQNIDIFDRKCSKEQMIVTESMKVLEALTNTEIEKTKKVKADKAVVDNKLAKILKELEEVSIKFEEKKKTNEKELELLAKKSNVILGKIKDVIEESIVCIKVIREIT